ncbi:MAG TPA: lectin-like protein, partial [Phycisphaerae bacterium]|nr:lectin-like protein [Phycisphaerae bacterium]
MHARILRAGLLLAVVLTPVAAATSHADVRDTHINPANGHVYHLISQTGGAGMTWADAEAAAVARGGHLATINDAVENQWVWDRFHSWRNELWIGLTDQAVEGTFEWISGEPVVYTNWAFGEPSNSGNEDYVHLWGPVGEWNDASSGHANSYGLVELAAPFGSFFWAAPANGDFHAGGKWFPPGPPTATDGAYFAVAGTYTVGFSAPATTLLTRVETGDVTFDLGGNTYSVIEAFVGSGPAGLASLSLADGILSCGRGSVGYNPGEVGVLNVGAGATWNCTAEALVGDFGQGTLNVAGGGTVTSASARLGDAPGSLGDAHVTGTGASWVNSGFLYVGYEGVGSLRVGPGAEVRGEGIFAGEWPGAAGSIEVRGQAALLVGVGTEWITIGRQGGGSLTVAEGGTVWAQAALNLGGWVSGSGQGLVTDPNTLLDVGGELIVGDGGEGSLVVRNGAAVQPHRMLVGKNWPSRGEVLVTGPGTTLILPTDWLFVGGSGVGQMTVLDQAAVDVTSGSVCVGSGETSSGRLTVAGGGTRLDASNGIYVGDQGAGMLELLDGGEARAWSLWAGRSERAVGAVCISGAGSRMDLDAEAVIGENGTASLTVRDGALLTATSNLVLGLRTGSRGEASVTAAEVQIGGTLRVGEEGKGILYVRDGGQITAGNGLVIGRTAFADGQVFVSGPGSRVVNTAGSLYVGESGSGKLTVSDGAEVRSEWWIALSVMDGSYGTVAVLGPNTLLWSETGGITIGSASSAALYVRDGAMASVDSEIVLAEQSAVHLYNTYVEVREPGSLLESRSSGIRVGRRGNGVLSVQNGGTVLCQWATIGNEDAAAMGQATIYGAGSRWIIEHDLNVGDVGTGRMEISAAAVVESQYGRIGNQPGSSGKVFVGWPGSTWQLAEWLSIGNSGEGTLWVYDGGLVSVPWDINVNNASTVDLDGGRIETTILRFHGGTADLTGFGTVAARAHGYPRVVIASGGTLTLGDPSVTDGFALTAAEGFVIESDATLEVLDADYAQLWGPSFQLNNGVLIGRNGLEINVDP